MQTQQRGWHRLFICLCALVMLATAAALWQYFGFGNQSSWGERAMVFEDSALQLPPELAGATGRIRLVHFWDPECAGCNRETSAHLSYLISMYRREMIDFFSVQKPGTKGQLPVFLQGKLKPLTHIAGMERIPASPFVAIWDGQGQLAYAGPYSLGMVCTSANSFVEPLLERLFKGEHLTPTGILAVGCYCPWAEPQARQVGD